jgi:Fe-Mn family superoxide dismutase
MTYSLPKLAYGYDALEPYIDTLTMEIHHTKHHQTYVDKLNAALQGQVALQGRSVEQLIRNLSEIPESIRTAVRNHGGGHANHSFYWNALKKDVAPNGPVVEAIRSKYGTYEKFREQFSNTAALLFGSGWTWLTLSQGELSIVATPNQDSPISQGMIPLLGLDVWEHAYYLKYQNRRPDYIAAFFNIIDWNKVNEHYQAARKQ